MKLICADNIPHDEKALRKVFPTEAITLDYFHFLQRIFKACKRGSPYLTETTQLAASRLWMDMSDSDLRGYATEE